MNSQLLQRIQNVKEKIQQAAEKSNQNPQTIQLLAVTKTVSIETIQIALECGLTSFGENRVEEAENKVQKIPSATWHLIGHLQSRKVKKALSLFNLIHSVDSIKLLDLIERHSLTMHIPPFPVLLEVNVSGESSKYGFALSEIHSVISQVERYKNLLVQGLMTMAPLNPNPESSRPYFKKLHSLFNEFAKLEIPNLEMKYLSMGMSQDFEVAIEEGANIVRVGSALFEGL